MGRFLLGAAGFFFIVWVAYQNAMVSNAFILGAACAFAALFFLNMTGTIRILDREQAASLDQFRDAERFRKSQERQ